MYHWGVWLSRFSPGVPSVLGCRPSWGAVHPGVPFILGCRPSWGAIHPGVPSVLGCRPSWGAVRPGAPSSRCCICAQNPYQAVNQSTKLINYCNFLIGLIVICDNYKDAKLYEITVAGEAVALRVLSWGAIVWGIASCVQTPLPNINASTRWGT
jgi:hypothetical protein